MALPIGLQLYTVRDALAKDFAGTLEQVAGIGYRHVEMAGLHKQSPEQVRALLDKFQLQAIAAHIGIDTLEKNLDAAIAEARVLGYQYLVCPWLGENRRGLAGYRAVARLLNDVAGKLAPQGLKLAYHNHSFEYQPLDDAGKATTGMDILFGESDPKLVLSELDLYWVQHGGEAPVARMAKLRGRAPLLHIKDMAAGPERKMAEVGTGIIDFKAVVAAAAQPGSGVRCLVIEQDNNWIGGNPIESARVSYRNFKPIAG